MQGIYPVGACIQTLPHIFYNPGVDKRLEKSKTQNRKLMVRTELPL